MKGRVSKKRAQAADVKEAVKAGKLTRGAATKPKKDGKKRSSKKKAIDTVMALAQNRYDDDTKAYIQTVYENGMEMRDLLVLATMEWCDITSDMESGVLRKGEGYRLRTQILETLRKLTEHQNGGASIPNMIQINVNAPSENRLSDAGKPLELAG